MVVIVVALDDCTMSVTKAPQNAPDNGVAAALRRVVRSPEPANALRPAVMTLMPSKNSPTPPRTEIVVDMQATCYAQRHGCTHCCRLSSAVLLRLRQRVATDNSAGREAAQPVDAAPPGGPYHGKRRRSLAHRQRGPRSPEGRQRTLHCRPRALPDGAEGSSRRPRQGAAALRHHPR